MERSYEDYRIIIDDTPTRFFFLITRANMLSNYISDISINVILEKGTIIYIYIDVCLCVFNEVPTVINRKKI